MASCFPASPIRTISPSTARNSKFLPPASQTPRRCSGRGRRVNDESFKSSALMAKPFYATRQVEFSRQLRETRRISSITKTSAMRRSDKTRRPTPCSKRKEKAPPDLGQSSPLGQRLALGRKRPLGCGSSSIRIGVICRIDHAVLARVRLRGSLSWRRRRCNRFRLSAAAWTATRQRVWHTSFSWQRLQERDSSTLARITQKYNCHA